MYIYVYMYIDIDIDIDIDNIDVYIGLRLGRETQYLDDPRTLVLLLKGYSVEDTSPRSYLQGTLSNK